MGLLLLTGILRTSVTRVEENVQKSQDRILVTHAGSLPRGEPLGSMLIDQEAGKTVDTAALKKAIEARVCWHRRGK